MQHGYVKRIPVIFSESDSLFIFYFLFFCFPGLLIAYRRVYARSLTKPPPPIFTHKDLPNKTKFPISGTLVGPVGVSV